MADKKTNKRGMADWFILIGGIRYTNSLHFLVPTSLWIMALEVETRRGT